jgi:chromate transporter
MPEPGIPISTVEPPGLWRVFLSFLRLGAVSFGGPAMVAYIKRMVVSRKGWLSEEEFRQGVALCQAAPGATAMQCAAYAGLRTLRFKGAIAAFLGFGLPAFLIMLVLSAAYDHAAGIPGVASALLGLRVLVVALVAYATWTFGRSSIGSVREGLISAAAGALYFIGGNTFLIVLAAGLAGPLVLRHSSPLPQERPAMKVGIESFRSPALVLAFGAVLLGILIAVNTRLAALALVMMKVDILAFGGGFASLPLLYREVVGIHGWMSAGVFMDGIALGQVTPGPIVITATFVGYQVAGLLGSIVATLSIFLPSFFILLLAEPWFRRLQSSPAFAAATRSLVLSFVGLLASVTIHFARVAPWSVPSAILAGLALVALLRKVDVAWVVLVGGAVSAAIL